ncbi:uncharacterized protein LOC144132869 [Amblyomma americanum]
MALVTALVTALSVFLPVIATTYNPACDFKGWDLDSAVNKFLSKLPESHVPYVHEFRRAFEGVETGPLNVTGLNRLRQLGPLVPYCAGEKRLLNVELLNEGDAVLSLPWRLCSGREGTLTISARVSRFTVLFSVASGGAGQDVKLSYVGPVLSISTENPKIIIHGAGKQVEVATDALSTFLSGLTHRVWNDYFFIYLRGAIRKALQEAFE